MTRFLRFTTALVLLAALQGCNKPDTATVLAKCTALRNKGTPAEISAFLPEVEQKIVWLYGPTNAFTRVWRGIQDPQAMTNRLPLKLCMDDLKRHL